jgi:hypothetical protein
MVPQPRLIHARCDKTYGTWGEEVLEEQYGVEARQDVDLQDSADPLGEARAPGRQ